MLLGFVILIIFHPGTVLQGPDSEFPRMSRAEKKLRKQAIKDAKKAKKDSKKSANAGWKRFFINEPLFDSYEMSSGKGARASPV